MRITVIGPGRAGTTIDEAARAAGHASRLTRDAAVADGDVVILAVPDAAVAEVARAVPLGPALGTLSGSVPLADLGPRERVFCLHPMQTIQPGGGLQLTGCAAGITASDAATAELVRGLAADLGMHPVDVPEASRPLPHLACVFASNLVLPALAAALRTLELAGLEHDRAALLGPLAHRALDNALADGARVRPTGPVARGDAGTLAAHRAVLAARDPDLERAYVALSSLLLPLVDARSADRAAAALEVPA